MLCIGRLLEVDQVYAPRVGAVNNLSVYGLNN